MRQSLLSWVAVLLVSATLAYFLDGVMISNSSAADQQADVRVGVSADTAPGAAALEYTATSSADRGAVVTAGRCAASDRVFMYVGLDPWIVAESGRIACEQLAP
jgi:hypothetical protein